MDIRLPFLLAATLRQAIARDLLQAAALFMLETQSLPINKP
jgi:hypothetical protein